MKRSLYYLKPNEFWLLAFVGLFCGIIIGLSIYGLMFK